MKSIELSRMVSVGAMLMFGAAFFPATAQAAPKLHTRDVMAHCGTEFEAISPGGVARFNALSDAEIERLDASDPMMQGLNSPEVTTQALQQMIQSTREDKYDPSDTSRLKDDRQLAGDRFFICMWQVRMDQLNGKIGATPGPSMASATMGQTDIDACTREIHAKQMESQTWGGDADAVAARLGQFQKDMFEGRCADHPEAQAYINGANRMLGHQAGAGGDGASNGSATGGKTKRSNVPEAQASHCLVPQNGGGVINNCDFAVEYIYCVVQPVPGSWSAMFDCNRGQSGSWQVGARSKAIMQTGGSQVAFFGCRYGPTLTKPDGISPSNFKYNPDGLPTGRCAEWGAP